MPLSPIRVLIVDDSAAVRQLLKSILQTDRGIEVVGVATDPFDAREKVKALNPHVITLDVEMPRMDGLTFLEKLMRGRPTPVVMVSSLTQRGADITLRALELGAVDFVAKPTVDTLRGVESSAAEIISKVKTAACARVGAPAPRATAPAVVTGYRLTYSLQAIGASTGGTEALMSVMSAMPATAPGTVIVQHMPKAFTSSFANRLNGASAMTVKEAEDGDRVIPGYAFVAPGDLHTEVVRSGAEYRLRVFPAPPVNLHRPSIDVMFDSVARNVGRNAVGAILTGMGADGADGLKRMRDAGARTCAQDEATSVVYGMPREAAERGAAEAILPLGDIPRWLLSG